MQLLEGAKEPLQLFVWAKSLGSDPAIATELIVKVALPVLVSVTCFCGLTVPTVCFPKLRLDGDGVAAGARPVPVRLTVCGLPLALSVTLIDAARAPEAVGVNVTLIVQLAFVARELPQLLLCAKSPAFVPVMPMLVMLNAAVPLLLSVTD